MDNFLDPNHPLPLSIEEAMDLALAEAKKYQGSTSPNPPVGAVLLSPENRVVQISAHQKSGEPHAEAIVLENKIHKNHTLVITMEPCSHTGKTPPCTDAIIQSKINRVVFGCKDPNPKTHGKSFSILKNAGIKVIQNIRNKEAKKLIFGFEQRLKIGIPKVLIKIALDENNSMLPPNGQKTFTRDSSLIFAHELRKASDAIMTGSGTLLNDLPKFTVRKVMDHPDTKRYLLIADRRKRISKSLIKKYQQDGFEVERVESVLEGFKKLGSYGVNQVMVEAGPTLSGFLLDSGYWNEKIIIRRLRDQDVIDPSWNLSPNWE